MLVARTRSFQHAGSCSRQSRPAVRCNLSFKPEHVLATVTATGVLLAPPAFASLPAGIKAPQGSDSTAVELNLDKLIEQRTGKAEALPELNDVPVGELKVKVTNQSKPLASGLDKAPAPALPVAPLAPAVVEPPPPAPRTPAAEEQVVVVAAPAEVVAAPAEVVAAPAKVVEAPAKVVEAPAPATSGLQERTSTAAPAAEPGNNGLLIGGGVAVLGVIAAAALANNGSGEQAAGGAAAPGTAPAAPATDAAAAEGAPAAAAEGSDAPAN